MASSSKGTGSQGAAGDGDERVTSRARELLPEEQTEGSENPQAQAAAILEESDMRQADRSAAPSTHLEERTSEDATEPVD